MNTQMNDAESSKLHWKPIHWGLEIFKRHEGHAGAKDVDTIYGLDLLEFQYSMQMLNSKHFESQSKSDLSLQATIVIN